MGRGGGVKGEVISGPLFFYFCTLPQSWLGVDTSGKEFDILASFYLRHIHYTLLKKPKYWVTLAPLNIPFQDFNDKIWGPIVLLASGHFHEYKTFLDLQVTGHCLVSVLIQFIIGHSLVSCVQNLHWPRGNMTMFVL